MDFKLLTDSASRDIVLDESLQAGPPIVLAYGIEGFKFPRVTCCFMIVKHSGDISA